MLPTRTWTKMGILADFISNSAILPPTRPQRRARGGVQLRPRA